MVMGIQLDELRKVLKKEIKEGLIKTYPSLFAFNQLKNKYGLDNREIRMSSAPNGIGNIEIVLNRKNAAKEDEINKLMETYGYVPGFRFVDIIYEPKHEAEISQSELDQTCRYLIHFSPFSKINKIKRNGFVPRSDNELYSYPERVYFFKYDNNFNWNEAIETVRRISRSRGEKEGTKYAVYFLDVKKIPDNARFYQDKNSNNGVYTSDNIPFSAVSQIKQFNI